MRNRIREWREAKNVRKADLARRVGCSRSYVTKLEAQRAQPATELAMRIARYLGQPFEQVFTLESEVAE